MLNEKTMKIQNTIQYAQCIMIIATSTIHF